MCVRAFAGRFELGARYFEGRGVPQSNKVAAMWTRKSAEQDHGSARLGLATGRRRLLAEKAKCSTIKDDNAFCGQGKTYDASKKDASCAAAACNKATAGDITACCKAEAAAKSKRCAGAQFPCVDHSAKEWKAAFPELIAELRAHYPVSARWWAHNTGCFVGAR